jgi:MoaA/NifB/PqqE/SkfB family radical SAM enzyme
MGQTGVKAIMFAGEGEPFLHQDMPIIAKTAKNAGIDISFTTNGVLMTPEKTSEILPLTSWIKVSCNAGTAETYSKVHRAPGEDFDKMWRNLEAAANQRARLGAGADVCTLGFQILVLPENRREVAALAAKVRDIGGDYLVIKPYSVSPKALHTDYHDLCYGNCNDLEEVKQLSTASFKVIFRRETLERRENPSLTYPHCLALPFWGYVDSGANFWGCLRHIGEEDFNFGNLSEKSFEEILTSPKRLERLNQWSQSGDIKECHVACRMDAVNSYLWALRVPSPHVNFV